MIEKTFSGKLLEINVSKSLKAEVSFEFLWIAGYASCIGLLLFLLFKFIGKKRDHDVELEIGLGDIGKITIKSNHLNREIAHRVWSEIMTRKCGIKIDPEHDVIVEIYKSWYELFTTTRKVISEIPGKNLSKKNTEPLVNLLVESLNKGLRPHLTEWQAKYRRWYDNEAGKPENAEKTPQEIQKTYPYYENIIKDMENVNSKMISYAGELKKIIDGK